MTNRQHGNEFSQTKEEAMRILYDLVHARMDGTYTEFSAALQEAVEFLGYDNPTLFTIKVIAEQWRSSWDGPVQHKPLELSFVMEKQDALSHWLGQTVWLKPEMGENFACPLTYNAYKSTTVVTDYSEPMLYYPKPEGPYGRFAQEVLDGIFEKNDIRVIAYSHMSIDREWKE